jgi:putative ABC transport system ATP-binding protein
MIQLSGVHKSFAEGERVHAVLAGVDLHVPAGEWVSLLGPSGSGKSTMLNLISGIDLPDRGTVEVGGIEIATLGERERTLFRRQQIGFVFQFFNLLPTLTVAENLLLPLELSAGKRAGAEARDSVQTLLSRVGLADRGDTFPDRLSGGERQRVAVARALAHSPSVVLADEPTGNLDHKTGDGVVALMRELVRERGTTLLVVTHSERLAGLGDRVVELDDGIVTEREASRR